MSDDWTNPAAWSGGAVPAATDGVIFPDTSAYTATVGAGESVGAGSVTINSDVISAAGATVRIAPGGTLTVAGPFTLGSGRLDLAGTLVGTLTAPAFPAQQNITEGPGETGVILTRGTLPPATGTLFADGGKIVGNPALSNVGLDVTGNNLTVQAPDGGPGQVTLNGSVLTFLGTQTFDNADVTLDYGTIESGQQYIPQQADVLTFGPHLHITAIEGSVGGVMSGSLVNEGTIEGAFTGDVHSFVNQGTVRIGANQTTSLLAYAGFTNAAGALIAVGQGATATLGTDNYAPSPAATLNAGTITVAAGASLTLDGRFDLTGSSPFASLGSIVNAGTLALDGTFVNTGATLRRSAFDAALGTTAVSGTLVGGTFIADSAKVPTDFSTLDDVTWQGAISLDGNESSLTVLDSLSMQGLGGTGQGNLALDNGATMIVRSAATVGAAVTVSGAAITVANGSIVGNLTLASDSTLSSTLPGAIVTVATSGSDTALANQGTITAAAPGGLFTIGSGSNEGYGQTTLMNLGRVVVADGDTMHVTGPIAAGNGSSEFDLATDGTLQLDDGSVNRATAGVAAGNTFAFDDGSASVLALDPAHFAGTISGFQPGNAIDLHGFFIGKPGDFSASAQPGRIAVTLGGQFLGNLAIAPGEDYSGAAFVFGTDGNGGATMQIAAAAPVLMTDTTTGATYTNAASAYAGPYGSLTSQFIYGGAHNVAMRATTPNLFLVAGSGTNALAVTSGNNVLSSGAGSAFMVGGSGDDTFFLDGRSGRASWDTVVNFHADDTMTLWGFTPGVSQLSWADNQGASGYAGATLHVDIAGNGRVDDAVTFAGISGDAASHFALSTGTVGGVPYLALTG